MKLYIDTRDQKKITVALKDSNKLVQKLSGQNLRGSEILLPIIVKLLNSNNLTFSDLSGIEVEEGLGSFTGLRVGASVAQALGFALNIPLNGQVGKLVILRYT